MHQRGGTAAGDQARGGAVVGDTIGDQPMPVIIDLNAADRAYGVAVSVIDKGVCLQQHFRVGGGLKAKVELLGIRRIRKDDSGRSDAGNRRDAGQQCLANALAGAPLGRPH
jgi:hypothetical protein